MTKEQADSTAKQFLEEATDLLGRMKAHGKELIGNTDDKQSFVNHGEAIAQHTLSLRNLESCIGRQELVLRNIG